MVDGTPCTRGSISTAVRSARAAAITVVGTIAVIPLILVLFGTFPDRHAVWQGLLDRGVLIRETGPDGWLRVSVGTPQEMAAFRTALQEVLP